MWTLPRVVGDIKRKTKPKPIYVYFRGATPGRSCAPGTQPVDDRSHGRFSGVSDASGVSRMDPDCWTEGLLSTGICFSLVSEVYDSRSNCIYKCDGAWEDRV